MTVKRLTINDREVEVGYSKSKCSLCGCDLTLVFDEWWDELGFTANATDRHPWHPHQPVVDELAARRDRKRR